MPRVCTICTHPQRVEIDKAIVAGESIQTIANRFPVSAQAVKRHRDSHLVDQLVRAAERTGGVVLPASVQTPEMQAIQETADLDVMTELKWIFHFMHKLAQACDDWLTDPTQPERYDLSPRAHEINVVYEDIVYDEEGNGHTKKGKARLSDLLAIAREPDPDRAFTLVETKTADPRKLIVATAERLHAQIELLAKLVGELDERPINVVMLPGWTTFRTALLEALAPYPEAKVAVGERLVMLGAGEA